MTDIIGYFAAVCTTASFLPQAIKIIKTKDTKAISLPMYVLFFTGVLSWTIYGILTSQPPVIWANLITLVLVLIILILKIKHG